MKLPHIRRCTIKRLTGNLEFAGSHHSTAYVMKLVDINAPVVIAQVNGSALRHIFSLVHFFTLGKIVDLDRIPSLERFLKIKCDKGSGGVRIKLYNRVRRRCSTGLPLSSVDRESYKDYE